ncbi:MAG TPA: hypothetical protein VNM90_04505, partial [Haliangium sp.]|nr:hypothetical protein [Haliangium sp.]
MVSCFGTPAYPKQTIWKWMWRLCHSETKFHCPGVNVTRPDLSSVVLRRSILAAVFALGPLIVTACDAESDSDITISDTKSEISASLGDGWFGTNLGNSAAIGGTSSFNGSTLTAAGGGGDLWQGQDNGHYVYRTVAGDFDFSVRVTGFAGDTSGTYAKAAVVFKASAANDGGEPSSTASGIYQSLNFRGEDYWYVRNGTNVTDFNSTSLNVDGQGTYLRLTRAGNVFRTYHSDDGVNWLQHGGDRIVALSGAGYIGVGVTSTGGSLMSATFTNLVLTLPPPDTTAPAISNLTVTPAGNKATVAWTTDEPSSSVVAFGLTEAYGSTASASALATAHAVVLTGLTESTLFHLRVSSTDVAGNTASSADTTFDSGLLPPTALPNGWSSRELGDSSGGDATFTSGVFTVSGNGGDLWGSQDNGHFAYTAVSGDFEIIAQVDGYEGDTSYLYAKAALVFKAATGAGAPTAIAPGIYQSLNYASEDYWYVRGQFGIGEFSSAVLNATGGSALLRMTRTGNVFRSYHWDGTAWVQHGTDRVVSLNPVGYVGLGVTSGTTNGLLTARFSNVSVVGNPPPPGS